MLQRMNNLNSILILNKLTSRVFKCYRKNVILNYSNNCNELITEKDQSTLNINSNQFRTHYCGELTLENIHENVKLCGWMEFQRMGKFLTLRDFYGSIQLIIPDNKTSLIKIVEQLTYESVLSVNGQVIARPIGQENEKMKTGQIEIQVNDLQVLNNANPSLPFYIRKHNFPKDSLQLQYRYLGLRFPFMQNNLRTRSQVIHKMRRYLIEDCQFVDIETPTLFKRTPGGAQEFIVPTQYPGKFYSLVQSPQQFKQLLMIGGIDRYFQFARCYRDEKSRPDRQPEFTQLDIEMAFIDCPGIIKLIENLLSYSWPANLGKLSTPFKQINYEDAMEIYGTDQPDLRIPYRIFNVSSDDQLSAYALSIPNGSEFLTTSVKNKLNDIGEKNFSGAKLIQLKISDDSWVKKVQKLPVNTEKLMENINVNHKDALFVAYGDRNDSRKLVGKIRNEFTDIMESNNRKIRSEGFEFVWIYDFPLFEKNKEDKIVSTHHPFTAPHPDDVHLLKMNPLKVRGLHYDLVLNGSEVAGGSIRVHNPKLQQEIFNILGIDGSSMKHLLEALSSGAPPHGGIAFGMDRLIAMICKTPNIKNVIAFPKTMEGRDLMSGAPDNISDEEKKLYHIETVLNDELNEKINVKNF